MKMGLLKSAKKLRSESQRLASNNAPYLKPLPKALAFLTLLLSLVGCSNYHLSPSPPSKLELPSTASQDKFCIENSNDQEDMAIKIMFLVDVSGSNADTDPYGKRFDHINQFVETLEQQERPYEYGFIWYEHGTDIAAIHGFTEDVNDVYRATASRGGSRVGPNGQAFSLAEQFIREDRKLGPANKYVVFFISDGRVADEHITEASNLVDNMEGVYVSSAYYGPKDLTAIARLEEVARVGKGTFTNFEIGENWDLNLLLSTQAYVVPWSLKEFLIYNLNAGFCLDGHVGVDSDVDGMCDRDEIAMSKMYKSQLAEEGKTFDPTNRFSFGDGYGDFFHWLRFKYPGKVLAPCEDRSDEDFDLLTKCEEDELKLYAEEEEIGPQTGDPKVFDTDKDGVLDGIETFVYFSSQFSGGATRYTAALDPENLDDNLDGEGSVLAQIRQHRNPWFSDPDQPSYDTLLSPIIHPSWDCYSFEQNVLPLYDTLEVKAGSTLPGLEHAAGENSVMAYYIQVPQARPKSVGVLKRSIQKIYNLPLSPGLHIKTDLFIRYSPPPKDKGLDE